MCIPKDLRNFIETKESHETGAQYLRKHHVICVTDLVLADVNSDSQMMSKVKSLGHQQDVKEGNLDPSEY